MELRECVLHFSGKPHIEVGVNAISSQLEIVYVFKAKKSSKLFENIL